MLAISVPSFELFEAPIQQVDLLFPFFVPDDGNVLCILYLGRDVTRYM